MATAERDDQAVRHVVERMAMLLNDYGYPRMPGRVLIALMVADEESLTATELSDRLDVSPAAISGALRYLTQVGFITREPAPGARSDRYRLPDDTWYEAMITKRGALSQIAGVAAAGVASLGASTAGGRRLGQMQDFFLFCEDELDGIVDRWRARHPS